MRSALAIRGALFVLVRAGVNGSVYERNEIVDAYLDKTRPFQGYVKTFEREVFIVVGLLADAFTMGLQYLRFLERDFSEEAAIGARLTPAEAEEIIASRLGTNR